MFVRFGVVLLATLFLNNYCLGITFTPAFLQCGEEKDVTEISSFPYTISSTSEIETNELKVIMAFENKIPTLSVVWKIDDTKFGGGRIIFTDVFEKAWNTPTAQVFKQFVLADYQWDASTIITDECEGTFFRANLTGGGQYEISYYVYKKNLTLEYGGIDFDFLPNVAKFSVFLGNYSYQPIAMPAFKVDIEFDDDFHILPVGNLSKIKDFEDFKIEISEYQKIIPFEFIPKNKKRIVPENDNVPRATITFDRAQMNITFFQYGLRKSVVNSTSEHINISSPGIPLFADDYQGFKGATLNITFKDLINDTSDIESVYYDPTLDCLLSFTSDGKEGDFGEGTDDLSGGEIVGIVFGTVIGAVIIVGVAVFVVIVIIKTKLMSRATAGSVGL